MQNLIRFEEIWVFMGADSYSERDHFLESEDLRDPQRCFDLILLVDDSQMNATSLWAIM